MSLSAGFSVLLCLTVTAVHTITCPNLGSAANFTVVAASAVTNTGPTVISGNVAMSPTIALTGFILPAVINGNTALGTAVAVQAQKDVIVAYNYCKGVPLTELLTGVDLAGKTLGPGVYKFQSAAEIIKLAGTLTLNGTGIYIFQVDFALTTSANSKILGINGAQGSCIFWQIGSSVTLGANSQFLGNILAFEAVTFGINVTCEGSVYAQTAAVTLMADTIIGQNSCDVCSTIPNKLESQTSGYLHQNIPIFIPAMLLLFLF